MTILLTAFATEEILEPKGYSVSSLAEIGFTEEIEETGHTFEENAILKARFEYFLEFFHFSLIMCRNNGFFHGDQTSLSYFSSFGGNRIYGRN
jgi:hypothetical protein